MSAAIAAKALFFTVNGRGMQRAAPCGTAAFADRRRAFGSVPLLPSSEQIRDRPRAPLLAPACSRCPETNFPHEFLKRRTKPTFYKKWAWCGAVEREDFRKDKAPQSSIKRGFEVDGWWRRRWRRRDVGGWWLAKGAAGLAAPFVRARPADFARTSARALRRRLNCSANLHKSCGGCGIILP